MKENNYSNQIKIEDIQRKNSTAESVDFGKLSVEEAQEYIINNFVNQDKFTDTTKRLPDGREIHPNTDVFDTYIKPMQIRKEQQVERERSKYKAFLSVDSFNLVQKRLNREINFEEFKKNFFVFDVETEILFGTQNTVNTLGRIISYLDPSEYDRENPVNTKKYIYVANFSETDEINNKKYTVYISPDSNHPKNMETNTSFFANPQSAIKIEALSKQNRNHLQK